MGQNTVLIAIVTRNWQKTEISVMKGDGGQEIGTQLSCIFKVSLKFDLGGQRHRRRQCCHLVSFPNTPPIHHLPLSCLYSIPVKFQCSNLDCR